MFKQFFQEAPEIRPSLNIGFPFDISTGTYFVGKHGESILNGGLMYVTGIGGRGNTFKSTVAHHMVLTALNRYKCSKALFYDAEPPSISRRRLRGLSKKMDYISENDLFDNERVTITDSSQMSGNKLFDAMKKYSKEKIDKARLKENTFTTPFIDDKGNVIKTFFPTFFEKDSLSMMPFDSVDAIYEKNEVGDSGMNVEAMKSSAAKSQMLLQYPSITANYNNFIIATAHMGDDIVMDPYAPPQKKLTFLKNKLKFKNVPEKFTFLTNNLWITISASVLAQDGTKTPLYPKDKDDDVKGDTDLQCVIMQNLRAKNGPTGMPVEIIISQNEGVLVGLTEFNYIKAFDRFGLGGNLQNYYLELVPDVNLSRTTIRGKIDSNDKIRRALEITAEMLQIFNLHDIDAKYKCTPKELYEQLKEKGYDWDVLLNTRGYWVYEETPEPLNFLSTMDLLKMRVDEYKPYWLNKTNKGLSNVISLASDEEATKGTFSDKPITPLKLSQKVKGN